MENFYQISNSVFELMAENPKNLLEFEKYSRYQR